MTQKLLLSTLCIVTCISCASTTQMMQSTIGKDISQVMVEYGPPAAQFNLPDGRRAYQWVIRDNYTSGSGYTNNWTGITNINATTSTVSCNYTLYTLPNGQGGWSVVGYEPPKAGCEYIIR